MATKHASKLSVQSRNRMRDYSRPDAWIDRGRPVSLMFEMDREPPCERALTPQQLLAYSALVPDRLEPEPESPQDREPIRVVGPRRLSTAARIRQSRQY